MGLAGFNHNNSTTNNNILSSTINMNKDRLGAREALTSLGLLCLGMLSFSLFNCLYVCVCVCDDDDVTVAVSSSADDDPDGVFWGRIS